jgi:ATP-dependent DNA helicase RecQ
VRKKIFEHGNNRNKKNRHQKTKAPSKSVNSTLSKKKPNHPPHCWSHLQEHFGFDAFKDNQDAIIQSLLSGKDTFVIMPTGGGKSLCYQLPAIISEGVAIIVSPLIALMKNQVDLVRSYSSKDSVAHFLNSTLNKKQIREVHEDLLNGHTKMLYVAPETLTKQENMEFFSDLKISFLPWTKRIVSRNGDMISGPNTAGCGR